MSSIANLSSAPSALPPVNVHPHGHKRGSHVEPTDNSSSDTAAQIPPGATQNMFGSLLQSLEQVIGVQPTTAAPATAATPAVTATSAATASTAATLASATSGAGTAASTTASTAGAASASTQSASTLLQNYLNNLAQNLQANGSPIAKFAGSHVSVNA
jgi:hypothetical protein